MTFQHSISIKIDGQTLDTQTFGKLQDCIVEQSLYIPDMFTIRFVDADLKLVDSSDFKIGTTVEIGITVAGVGLTGENSATLIKGEITAVEPLFKVGANYLVVRGYNQSWRGYRETKQQTFLKQKDKEVIETLGGDIGISTSVDSTKTTHEYLAQDNQSSGEYWIERSRRLGMKVLSEGGENLKVVAAKTTTETVTLKLGEGLISFEPRATAAHQVNKVTVKGWDPAQKKAFVGSASSSETHPKIGMGSGIYVSKQAFGEAEITIVDQPVVDASDAEAIAKGQLDRLNGAFVQAEGVALMSPQIRPGKKVNLEAIGTKFSGEYMITSTNHVYSNTVMETAFTVTGIGTNTFAELLSRQEPMRRWHGVYPAVVTDNNDPDDTYRVKVKFPWLDDDFESAWARIVAPDAGPDRGFYFLPEIDDEVLVAFEHGDIIHPYILGRLWNGQDAAPKPNSEVISGGLVNERIIKSRSGHTILFDDTDGSEMIKIFSKSENDGHTITMNDNSSKIFTLECASGAKITIDGDSGKIDIEGNADISIKSKANINIESTGDMKLNAGKNLTMEAKLNASLKGLQLALEGKTKADLKGLTVSVAGSTLTEVKGALVKIN